MSEHSTGDSEHLLQENEALRRRIADLELEVRRNATDDYRFRIFFDNAPIGKSMTAPDGRLLLVNQAFGAMLGYSVEEMQAMNWANLTHPDDLREARECVRSLLAGERDTWTMEKRYLAKSGQYVWASVTTRLQRDEEGRPLHFLTHVQDITAHKRIEDELRIKDQVFDASIAAQSIADTLGVMTHVNNSFLRMWRYSRKEDVLGHTVGSFFVDPVQASAVLEALASKGSWEGEFLARRADGTTFFSHGFAASLRNGIGELVGYQSTNLDVTNELETNAKLVRSNEDLEQFAYVASHDLQEPLRMVSSFTQLLAQRYQDKLDQDAKEFIGYAVDGANRMQRLIQDLLTYSRVTTRGQDAAALDSHDALGEAVRNLHAAITESGALVTNEELPWVLADRVQFVQIFQNLIGNGIKFHKPSEAPRVHLSAERSLDPPGFWIFKVADNGIGIEPRHFDRLFVLFQRLHGRQDYAGTGIGLALCKRIVERHGGKIWLESACGKGTTVFFTVLAAEQGKRVQS